GHARRRATDGYPVFGDAFAIEFQILEADSLAIGEVEHGEGGGAAGRGKLDVDGFVAGQGGFDGHVLDEARPADERFGERALGNGDGVAFLHFLHGFAERGDGVLRAGLRFGNDDPLLTPFDGSRWLGWLFVEEGEVNAGRGPAEHEQGDAGQNEREAASLFRGGKLPISARLRLRCPRAIRQVWRRPNRYIVVAQRAPHALGGLGG